MSSVSKAPITAKNRTRNEQLYKCNIIKKAKNQGEAYVSYSGKSVPAKEFKEVSTCCWKRCYENIVESEQKKLYNSFWKLAGNYESQNVLLAGLMTMRPFNEKRSRPGASTCDTESAPEPIVTWKYAFHTDTTLHETVCRQFLCNLLQIKKGRFETIQKKIKTDQSLRDKRGTHIGYIVLTEPIKEIIAAHLRSITKSRYRSKRPNLRRLKNPDLNALKMYRSFVRYYRKVTNNSEAPIGDSTYVKYLATI